MKLPRGFESLPSRHWKCGDGPWPANRLGVVRADDLLGHGLVDEGDYLSGAVRTRHVLDDPAVPYHELVEKGRQEVAPGLRPAPLPSGPDAPKLDGPLGRYRAPQLLAQLFEPSHLSQVFGLADVPPGEELAVALQAALDLRQRVG